MHAPFILAPRILTGRTSAERGTSRSCVGRSAHSVVPRWDNDDGGGGVGSSGHSRSSAEIILRASQISAQMLVIAAMCVGEAEEACDDEDDEWPDADLRGDALPLARSAAFLARCVAKVCSWTALSARPVSQVGSVATMVVVGVAADADAAGGFGKRAWLGSGEARAGGAGRGVGVGDV